uniref:Glucosidase 2 subunit beta n=1 Tax=Rhizochromulina marina TaxID=1034831 RepID=A0A7S2WID1_9STRA
MVGPSSVVTLFLVILVVLARASAPTSGVEVSSAADLSYQAGWTPGSPSAGVGQWHGEDASAYAFSRARGVLPEHPALVGVGAAQEPILSQVAGGGRLICDHGKRSVPPGRVNDDYCDCIHDGLDEISTGACAGVSANTVDFWCHNEGFDAHFIPSSRVGDGICDCCDGEDEVFALWHGTQGGGAVSPCPNTCGERRQVMDLRISDMREGLAVRDKLLAGIDEVFHGERAKAEELAKQLSSVDALRASLLWFSAKETRIETTYMRYDLFDNWADGSARTRCVVDSNKGKKHGSSKKAKKAKKREEDETGETSATDGDIPDACFEKPPLPKVVEQSGSGSPREHILDDLYIERSGGEKFTVRMQLERMKLKRNLPRTKQFPTRPMMRDQTTLFSWILNSNNARQRASQVGLHVVGLILSPVTLTVGPFLAVALNATESYLFPTVSEVEALAKVEEEVSDLDFKAEPQASWFSPYRWMQLLNPFRSSYVQAAYRGLKKVLRSTVWARSIIWHTPATLMDLLFIEKSTAYKRDLLPRRAEAILLQRGEGVAFREGDRIKKEYSEIMDQVQEDWGPDGLWFPFRTKCYEKRLNQHSYSFCPFKEVREGTRSLGKFKEFQQSRGASSANPAMLFADGDRKDCDPSFSRRRSARVEMACSSNFTILEVSEPRTCSFVMVFGTPIACTPEEVEAETRKLRIRYLGVAAAEMELEEE